jgi:hypothetical protein
VWGIRSPDDYSDQELADMYFSVTQEHAEQLGPKLTRQLGELLMGLRYARVPWPQAIIHRVRWAFCCGAIKEAGWSGAFARVADQLKDSPAQGSAPTMKRSYDLFQRDHPAEQRRRTWRRPASLG